MDSADERAARVIALCVPEGADRRPVARAVLARLSACGYRVGVVALGSPPALPGRLYIDAVVLALLGCGLCVPRYLRWRQRASAAGSRRCLEERLEALETRLRGADVVVVPDVVTAEERCYFATRADALLLPHSLSPDDLRRLQERFPRRVAAQ